MRLIDGLKAVAIDPYNNHEQLYKLRNKSAEKEGENFEHSEMRSLSTRLTTFSHTDLFLRRRYLNYELQMSIVSVQSEGTTNYKPVAVSPSAHPLS